jgi:hypothetical protein
MMMGIFYGDPWTTDWNARKKEAGEAGAHNMLFSEITVHKVPGSKFFPL